MGDPPHKREESKRLTVENLIALETDKQTNKGTNSDTEAQDLMHHGFLSMDKLQS